MWVQFFFDDRLAGRIVRQRMIAAVEGQFCFSDTRLAGNIVRQRVLAAAEGLVS